MITLRDVEMERYSAMKLVFIPLCALVSLSGTFAAGTEECGRINPEQFSNTEKWTQINEFPWMAKIAYRKQESSETSFNCHAVLIDPQHLLTAGHCLTEMSQKPYAVLFGDWDTSNNFTIKDCDEVNGTCFTPILIDIEKFVQHPLVAMDGSMHDIGLLRLTQKVTYSDYIRPICLPSNDTIATNFESKRLMVTGWVMRNHGLKQKLSVSIYKQEDCSKEYNEKVNQSKVKSVITDSHLCAKACEPGITYFSAAALMDVVDQESKPQTVYLAGLLSFGTPNCQLGVPDGFTRVDRYLDWIKEKMN